jgi:hypothetical protein
LTLYVWKIIGIISVTEWHDRRSIGNDWKISDSKCERSMRYSRHQREQSVQWPQSSNFMPFPDFSIFSSLT